MIPIKYTPEHISQLAPNEIFVFGSNLQGMHGGGAARYAYEHFGAQWGKGVGMAGQTYAIPTMQGGVETIKPYVDEFIRFARKYPQCEFLVTPIGCGIAGFAPQQIAPLFKEAVTLQNVTLPKEFYDVLKNITVSVNIDGHIYLLNSDYTASLLCYSEDAYRIYKRYSDWVIEALEGETFPWIEKHFGGDELSFSIPSYVLYENREYRVTSIEKGAFAFCVLLSIEIPGSVKRISACAFFRCIGLSTLVIPDSVERLDVGAVYDCPNLTYVKWRGKTHYSTSNESIVFPAI